MTKMLVVFSLIFLYACPAFAQPAKKAPDTGDAILGAFNEEVRFLQASVQGKKENTLGGVRFVSGTLNARPVVA
jgi:hypothetical protein